MTATEDGRYTYLYITYYNIIIYDEKLILLSLAALRV